MRPSTVRWMPSNCSVAASQPGVTQPSTAGPGNASHSQRQSAGVRISKTRASGCGVSRQIACGPSGERRRRRPSAPATTRSEPGDRRRRPDRRRRLAGEPGPTIRRSAPDPRGRSRPAASCHNDADHHRAAAHARTARASRSTTVGETRSSQGRIRPGRADHFSDETSRPAQVTNSYSRLREIRQRARRREAVGDEVVEHARADGRSSDRVEAHGLRCLDWRRRRIGRASSPTRRRGLRVRGCAASRHVPSAEDHEVPPGERSRSRPGIRSPRGVPSRTWHLGAVEPAALEVAYWPLRRDASVGTARANALTDDEVGHEGVPRRWPGCRRFAGSSAAASGHGDSALRSRRPPRSPSRSCTRHRHAIFAVERTSSRPPVGGQVRRSRDERHPSNGTAVTAQRPRRRGRECPAGAR